jgi:hypothetical protein
MRPSCWPSTTSRPVLDPSADYEPDRVDLRDRPATDEGHQGRRRLPRGRPRSCPQSGWYVGLFVVRRHELTDESWAVIEPLLAPPRMGRPVRDRRQVVNGILWKLSTGAAWRDLPERYGPWKTVYERFRRWSADAPGTGSWPTSSSTATPSAPWTGRSCVSTPPPCGLTSTRPGREKGGLAGRGARPVPWRADHEDPPRMRRAGPAAGLHDHRRQRQRLHPVRAGDGPHQHRAVRARTAQNQARAGRRGQGLLVHEDPRLPAQARYQGCHPGAD